ncbi:MAG: response regulator [Bacteroidetes bacterium]|nr:MAG: response regulator [Bacteroidota bacterium]GIV58275.1 MAG: hypothetical protein KatS3mg042_1188 [Rhodothermaceae bacterium]
MDLFLKPRILLVEDNYQTQRLVQHWLRDITVLDTVSRPEDALRQAGTQPYDLLLVDINLGQRDCGINLLADLRKMPGYAEVPAVAFTAYAMPDDRERLLNCGFNFYLSKPFMKQELLETIRNALCMSREPG